MKKTLWILVVVLAILIGFYPATYYLFDMSGALLNFKNEDLLSSSFWQLSFNIHIILGGLALIIGWPQFITKFRNSKIKFHKFAGKIYIISILFSGLSGLYLAIYATGGLSNSLGFSGLAISWLFTTCMAYLTIRQGALQKHQNWMVRSYALTFAAVTLRLWMPFLQIVVGMTVMDSYKIVSWLCWIPNILVAEMIIRNLKIYKKNNLQISG
jgi:hypothetical protein